MRDLAQFGDEVGEGAGAVRLVRRHQPLEFFTAVEDDLCHITVRHQRKRRSRRWSTGVFGKPLLVVTVLTLLAILVVLILARK
ncbi:hypothetical protein MYX65_07985 [Acidobacteria bacterium AH-259-L09]|nr:hypothetical protein [Acidobacteria bacterium AH-259-L09]